MAIFSSEYDFPGKFAPNGEVVQSLLLKNRAKNDCNHKKEDYRHRRPSLENGKIILA
jgi:hypothetical protein